MSALLVLLAQAQSPYEVQNSLANLVNRPIERARYADLDDTTLEKPGAILPQRSLAQPRISHAVQSPPPNVGVYMTLGHLGAPPQSILPRPSPRVPHAANDSPHSGPGKAGNDKLIEGLSDDLNQQERLKDVAAIMSDPKMQEKVNEIVRKDPELKKQFDKSLEAFKKDGLSGIMKSFKEAQDPEFMTKFAQKMAGTPIMSAALGDNLGMREDKVETLLDSVRLEEKQALELTQKLLGEGKDPNEIDDDGYTPLLYAITLRSSALVEMLAAGGAKTGDPDEKGNTPLIYAAATDCGPVLAALLDAGADPTVPNKKGKTAADVIRQNPKSTVAKDAELMGRLSGPADQ